jgi:hypothetical protein
MPPRPPAASATVAIVGPGFHHLLWLAGDGLQFALTNRRAPVRWTAAPDASSHPLGLGTIGAAPWAGHQLKNA